MSNHFTLAIGQRYLSQCGHTYQIVGPWLGHPMHHAEARRVLDDGTLSKKPKCFESEDTNNYWQLVRP